MMKDRTEAALIPNDETRYDKEAIYREGQQVGVTCGIEAIVQEFGGENINWQPNPRCMVGGYAQREDDLMISFNLPPAKADKTLSKAILEGFFGPKGINVEEM